MRALVCTLLVGLVGSPAPPRAVLPLLDELLHLLEQGGHTTQVSRLSRAIASECANAPVEIQELAQIGPHNFERDLHRWTSRQFFSRLLPSPYEFMVQFKRCGHRPHFAILPHELFGSIFAAGRDIFDRLFTGGRENLESWWAKAEEINDSWYRCHPVIHSTPDPQQRIPYGLHGDDAGMAGSTSVLVITWGSVAVFGPTLDTRLLFTMVKVNEAVKHTTLHEIYEVLRWSLEALARGRYPDRDHRGVLFSPGHHPERFKWANQEIAGGIKGAWSEMRGDWKYLREALHLQNHYGTNEVCHLCKAHSVIRRLHYTTFGEDTVHRRTLTTAYDWLHLYVCAVLVSPLILIPGFNIWRVLVDILHNLELGIYQYAAPSAMWQFTESPAKGGFFAGHDRQARFDTAYEDYRRWCAASSACEHCKKRRARADMPKHIFTYVCKNQSENNQGPGRQKWK